MKNKVRILGITILLLFPIFLLWSCSSPNKKSTAEKTGEPIHTVDTVTLNMMKFNPAEIAVNKGDTILWINKGLVAHTVKSYQENKFYSDTLKPGQAWKWIVTDSASYYCTLHPAVMKGNITIK